MSVIWNQFCIEKSRWEHESCPLWNRKASTFWRLRKYSSDARSVTLRLSDVERPSSSRRVRYQRLDCILL